mgnify:CR=1 FL=1
MTEEYEHIELFGKPALFTNARVDTHTVPDGWHVYDLRGSDNDPGSPCTLEILVVVNHAGSIVVPEPISFPDNQDYREIGDALDFLGDEITLTEFCKQYGLKTPPKYKLRPASREEAACSILRWKKNGTFRPVQWAMCGWISVLPEKDFTIPGGPITKTNSTPGNLRMTFRKWWTPFVPMAR